MRNRAGANLRFKTPELVPRSAGVAALEGGCELQDGSTLVFCVVGLAIGSAAGIPSAAQSLKHGHHNLRTSCTLRLLIALHINVRRTWYEFMLKQFNPDDVDYGRWIEHERQAFIEARIRNPYFLYSLCTTLGVAVVAVVCIKLWIDHRRAMWITAEMMADIYNQDAYSRRIAQEAIEKIQHPHRTLQSRD